MSSRYQGTAGPTVFAMDEWNNREATRMNEATRAGAGAGRGREGTAEYLLGANPSECDIVRTRTQGGNPCPHKEYDHGNKEVQG